VTMVNSLLMQRSEVISYHAAVEVQREVSGGLNVFATEVGASLALGNLGGQPAGVVGAGALPLELPLLNVHEVLTAAIGRAHVEAEELPFDLDHLCRFIAHLRDADSSFVTASRSPCEGSADGETLHSDGQEYGGRVCQGPEDLEGVQGAVQCAHGCLGVHGVDGGGGRGFCFLQVHDAARQFRLM
jgi:hypothetical protein